ncbi:hypothetical protein ACDW_29440 [Acidovorax sp. DW039]|uniref:hypothetical protein n=1 Tax=Acidovorax sp. DW039 TaxID=3095606 RepID=UPI00308CE1F6|nr:hypothetical protein ACDW_29440 [Acidovorax sp. DW039]
MKPLSRLTTGFASLPRHLPSVITRRWMGPVAAAAALATLVACSSQPPVPEWQLNAHGAAERALQAYLTGNQRVEAAEWARARQALASTGRADLLARAELLRCAAQVASLAMPLTCEGFAALAVDATPAEKAYARYLEGRGLLAGDVAMLPESQRATAQALMSGQEQLAQQAVGAAAPAEPLSSLVAAGVLFRAGRAGPQVVAGAVNMASAQGWRRPLMAWLTVQAEQAERAGDAPLAEQARRRLALMALSP